MPRFAVVNAKTNIVENCVVWEGAKWMAPAGNWVVQNGTVGIGDIYDPKTNSFTRPEQPQE
jgi:hypothetical protein